MPNILSLDATAQLLALESKRISAYELLEANQAALNSSNVRLNAVVAADFERAQERARAIDDHRARGDHLGALAGLPLTVKDSFDVEGLPASAGLQTLRGRRAADAYAVGRVRSQDAVIWGKTNVPPSDRDWQTAGGLYGTTNNPFDMTRTAGGSSGGGAAAVAAGLTALDIGSDSAGGLRLPASFCGVYSHKPTDGLIDNRGHVPPKPGAAAERDMLTPGPIARSARDLRLLLSALTEAPLPARGDPYDLSALRVAVWLKEPAYLLDAEVGGVIEAFVEKLSLEGAAVKFISAPVEPRGLADLYADLLLMAEGQDLGLGDVWRQSLMRIPAAALRRTGLGPWSWAGRTLSHTASHRHWMAANEARVRLRNAAREVFAQHHVILAPCAPVTAFEHQKSGEPLRCSDGRQAPYFALAQWNALAAVCGLPSTTVPAGFTLSGLPVGVQIMGPRGADSRTLAVAQALEDQVCGFTPPKM